MSQIITQLKVHHLLAIILLIIGAVLIQFTCVYLYYLKAKKKRDEIKEEQASSKEVDKENSMKP